MFKKVLYMLTLFKIVSLEHAYSSQYIYRHDGPHKLVYIHEHNHNKNDEQEIKEPARSSQYIRRYESHVQPVFTYKHERDVENGHHKKASNHYLELEHYYEDKQQDGKEHLKLIDYYAPSKYEFEYKVDDPHSGDHKYHHVHYDGHNTKSDYSLHVKHILPEKHHHERRNYHHN